jgi:hypothetical protein
MKNEEFLNLHKEYIKKDFYFRFKPICKIENNKLYYTCRANYIDYKYCNINIKRKSYGFKERPVICYKGNKIIEYKSLMEASRKECVNSVNIIQAANGTHKTAGGYKWEYKNKEERTYVKI